MAPSAPNPRRRPCYANSRLLQLPRLRWVRPRWRRPPPPPGAAGTAAAWHHGWHHGWGGPRFFVGGPAYYGRYGGCYVRRLVPTPWGPAGGWSTAATEDAPRAPPRMKAPAPRRGFFFGTGNQFPDWLRLAPAPVTRPHAFNHRHLGPDRRTASDRPGSAQIVPARASALSAATASANRRCSSAIRGELPTETGTVTMPPRWRVGSLAQEAPNGPGKPDRGRAQGRPSATRCCAKPRPRTIRTGSPRSRPGSSTSTRIRRRRAPPRSSPASAFRPSRPGAALLGILRRLAHARRARRDAVRRARSAAARRADQLSRPRRHAVAEDHLARYPRTVIVISHDRDLLDTSVDQILHLDRGKLTLYAAPILAFEEQRADARDARRQARQAQEASASGCRPSSTASRPRPRRRARRSRASRCWKR
jgi:hypothetical protein